MFRFVRDAWMKFRADQAGTATVEAVIALPMLLWAGTATFIFFDAYKAQNTTYRANYTISDVLSRETSSVDYNYLAGMYKVYRFMTNANSDSWIRVSQLQCVSDCDDEDTRVLQFDWSHAVNGVRSLEDVDFDFYRSKIPLLARSDRLVLVETFMQYHPPLKSILMDFGSQNLVSYTVTRPRFAPQLLWDPAYDPSDGGGHEDGSEDPEDGVSDPV